MKIRIAIVLAILLAIVIAAIYLRYAGVTHGDIVESIDARHDVTDKKIDSRADAIDDRLKRIEAKLDWMLELSDRPIPAELRRGAK